MVFQACEYFFSFATHKDTTSLYHLVDGRALAIRPFKREVQWDFSTTFAKMAKRLHLWICVSLRLMQHGNHWLVVKPIQDNTYSTIIYIYIHVIILKSYLFAQTLVFQWFVSHGQFNHQIRWDSHLLSNHSLPNFKCYIYTRLHPWK